MCNVPVVFNVFFDRLVKQVNERAMEKGVKMRDVSGRSFGN